MESSFNVIPTWKWFQFVIFFCLTIISLWVTIYTFLITQKTWRTTYSIICIGSCKIFFKFQRKHELIATPFLLQQPFACNWSSIHVRTTFRVKTWSDIFKSFVAILYDFKKQWLNRFVWKAMVVRPVSQKFICLVKYSNGTFLNEKKCKNKGLISHMVGEIVKKLGWARLFTSCNYSCTFYFLLKTLLVKLRI